MLQLSIGGIRCSFHIQQEDFRSLLGRRYLAFESIGPAKYDFLMDVRPLSYFVERNSISANLPQIKAEVSDKNGTLVVARASIPFQAVLDLATGRGIVRIHRDQDCFDDFLRVIYSLLLAEEGGILLQASAVSDRGEGNVFFGVSGSGKSTVAALARDRQVLTDELALIRQCKGEFRVFGTPFGQEFGGGAVNSFLPLRGLYLLKKDACTSLSAIPETAAVQELSRRLFFSDQPVALLEKALQTCCALAKKVTVRELHFQPDSSLRECISGAHKHGNGQRHSGKK